MSKIQKVHTVLCAIFGFWGFIVGAVVSGVGAGLLLLVLAALWWVVVSVVIRLLTLPYP